MELKYKNWNEVSISLYYKILDIIEDADLSAVEKDLAVCALLCDVPEEEVYNLSVSEANDLISKIQWLSSFEFSHKFKGGTIKIEDQEYTVDVDLQHMSIAQYIDFQNFYKPEDLRLYYGNLLACFIIPKGKKYGEGYDASKLAESLRENISIAKANEILFFFLKDCLLSIRASQIYLDYLMRRMRRKEKDPQRKLKIEALMEKIEEMNRLLIAGFVSSRNTPTQQSFLEGMSGM